MGQKLKISQSCLLLFLLILSASIKAEAKDEKIKTIPLMSWESSFHAEELFQAGKLWNNLDLVQWKSLNELRDPIYSSKNMIPPILWTRVKLPKISKSNTYYMRKLFLSTFYDVYFRNEKIHTYREFENTKFLPIYEKLDYFLLPASMEGEYLYIRTDYLVKFDYAFENFTWIGKLGDLLEYNIQKAILPLLLSFVIISIGFIAFFLFILNLKNSYKPLLYFSIMNLSIGLAILSQNELIFIIYNHPILYFSILNISSLLIPIGIIGFFSHTLGKNLIKTTHVFQKINLCILFVYFINYYFISNPETYFLSAVINRLLQTFYFIEFSYILFQSIQLGKNSVEARIFSIGIFFLLTFILSFIFYLFIFFESTKLPIWGCLLFLISMGVALERDFRLKRQKLILMKKEYEIQQKTFHLAQLSRLKEKLSPHFFFNSLNTLHAYTNLNSKLAKISIDSMIENYKFLEEHVDSNLVPFDKEWEFTKIYCRLQKVRYLDRLKIKFKKSGDFSNILIPPLSIQPLIENAFKHGFQNSSERIWKLNIEADIINNQIDISIKDNGSGLEYKENYFQRSLGNIQFRINYFFESNSIKISNLDLGGTGIQIQYSPILKSHSHD